MGTARSPNRVRAEGPKSFFWLADVPRFSGMQEVHPQNGENREGAGDQWRRIHEEEAALGVADYGLAHAFNGMAFDIGFSGISIIPALLILLVGQLVVFTLGLIGSGINSLRLQYVECFPKFFVGGGTDYTPFGYTRKYTHETETTA